MSQRAAKSKRSGLPVPVSRAASLLPIRPRIPRQIASNCSKLSFTTNNPASELSMHTASPVDSDSSSPSSKGRHSPSLVDGLSESSFIFSPSHRSDSYLVEMNSISERIGAARRTRRSKPVPHIDDTMPGGAWVPGTAEPVDTPTTTTSPRPDSCSPVLSETEDSLDELFLKDDGYEGQDEVDELSMTPTRTPKPSTPSPVPCVQLPLPVIARKEELEDIIAKSRPSHDEADICLEDSLIQKNDLEKNDSEKEQGLAKQPVVRATEQLGPRVPSPLLEEPESIIDVLPAALSKYKAPSTEEQSDESSDEAELPRIPQSIIKTIPTTISSDEEASKGEESSETGEKITRRLPRKPESKAIPVPLSRYEEPPEEEEPKKDAEEMSIPLSRQLEPSVHFLPLPPLKDDESMKQDEGSESDEPIFIPPKILRSQTTSKVRRASSLKRLPFQAQYVIDFGSTRDAATQTSPKKKPRRRVSFSDSLISISPDSPPLLSLDSEALPVRTLKVAFEDDADDSTLVNSTDFLPIFPSLSDSSETTDFSPPPAAASTYSPLASSPTESSSTDADVGLFEWIILSLASLFVSLFCRLWRRYKESGAFITGVVVGFRIGEFILDQLAKVSRETVCGVYDCGWQEKLADRLTGLITEDCTPSCTSGMDGAGGEEDTQGTTAEVSPKGEVVDTEKQNMA